MRERRVIFLVVSSKTKPGVEVSGTLTSSEADESDASVGSVVLGSSDVNSVVFSVGVSSSGSVSISVSAADSVFGVLT